MSKMEAAAVGETISALKVWDQNPRDNSKAIQSVADSIQRFGFAAPIVARKADGMIIAGHTRLAAAKQLQLETVPVRYLDISLEDAKRLALADNKLGEIADWDDEMLAQIISDFRAEDLDLDGLGWNEDELDALSFINFAPALPEETHEEETENEAEIHTCPHCGGVL